MDKEVQTEVLEAALQLLKSYLHDFPEHDQGDFRIWQAAEIIENIQQRCEKL